MSSDRPSAGPPMPSAPGGARPFRSARQRSLEGHIALLLRRPRKARIAVLGHRHGHQVGEQPDTLGERQGPEAAEPGFELRQVLRCRILWLPAEYALQMFDDRMKGARRVKRRTADRHPDVILAGRLS